MDLFTTFLVWLMRLDPLTRLIVTMRELATAILRLLVDLATGELRPHDPATLALIEASLRIVEAGVPRATWLRARQIAGLPRNWPRQSFRHIPVTALNGQAAMANRVLDLLERLHRIEALATRLARTMSRAAEHDRPRHPLEAPCTRLAHTSTHPAPTSIRAFARPHPIPRQTGPPALANILRLNA